MSSGPALDPVTLEELRRLARSRPRSGRESVAKASAIRTLERWRGSGASSRCRRCLKVGIRMSPATRSTSSIGCSCTSTRTSCSGIGSWRGARGECECPGCYSRSPTASRASLSRGYWVRSNDLASPHQIDEADGMLSLDSAGPPATGLANQSHNHFIGVDQPTNLEAIVEKAPGHPASSEASTGPQAEARRVRRIDVVKRIEFRSSWSFHIVALPE